MNDVGYRIVKQAPKAYFAVCERCEWRSTTYLTKRTALAYGEHHMTAKHAS